MRKKWMVLAVAGLISLWLASGVAYADEGKGKTESKAIGNIQVELITPADGAVVGENNIAVHLKDNSTGQPVVRRSVRVELSMDQADSSMNHGDMSKQEPIVANLVADKAVPGQYSGRVSLTNAGDWKAQVVLDPSTVKGTASFGVQVKDGGPNLVIIGGFIGLLALIVVAAAVVKRKTAGIVPVGEPSQS